MRFTRLVLAGLLATLAACTEPAAPVGGGGVEVTAMISISGVVVMTDQLDPRLGIQVAQDKTVLLVNGDGLAAELGNAVIVTGNYLPSGEFYVSKFERAENQGELSIRRG